MTWELKSATATPVVVFSLYVWMLLAQAPLLSCFASLASIRLCIMLMQMWKAMMVTSLMLLTARVFSHKDCQHAEDCQPTDSEFALIGVQAADEGRRFLVCFASLGVGCSAMALAHGAI